MAKRRREFKRCPRCETKVLITEKKCPICGLVYARLAYATNYAAKRAFKHKEPNKVIFDKVLPADIVWWKLLLITICCGFLGGHRFYVGRYKSASYILITMLILFGSACIPLEIWNYDWGTIVMTLLIGPGAIGFVIWAFDLFAVLFRKFKIPVSIDENLMATKNSENYKTVIAIVRELDKKVSKKQRQKIVEQIKQEQLELEAVKNADHKVIDIDELMNPTTNESDEQLIDNQQIDKQQDDNITQTDNIKNNQSNTTEVEGDKKDE